MIEQYCSLKRASGLKMLAFHQTFLANLILTFLQSVLVAAARAIVAEAADAAAQLVDYFLIEEAG